MSAPAARCVISPIMDADSGDTIESCVVHCHYAPCPRDGQPAEPSPLHSDLHPSREAAITAWRIRTQGQRPLVLHRGDMTDGSHDLAETCPCGPELLEAS